MTSTAATSTATAHTLDVRADRAARASRDGSSAASMPCYPAKRCSW